MSKVYRDTDTKPHALVKTLKKKGYTKIILTWGDAMSRTRGWRLETNEHPYLHLGYALDTAREKIKNLPDLNPVKV